ncbi:glycosyl transferase [Mycobacterium kyorinense]|uniref:Glycosyl transferase n=1 Tax=Mycobacterium kyorinense TaxID=487514 RepID=A0A1A2ZQP0_9MYCO|nr:nucleotide disphospho-sugar-binding domain-containing protein [Mycobacterium kyorinense]OBI51782.1 glycosyl transferase [Mycobacterium kyorinense]
MSSILIASVPAPGHVTPLLAVAENFVMRGDDVRFITGSLFAEKVAATGASFVPLPAEADLDHRTHLQTFPERAKLKGVKAIAFDIEHVFARPAKAQYETIVAALAAQPADAVLAEPVFVGAAFLLEHPRPARPPVVMCGVVPLCIESRDTAPFGMGLPPARLLNRPRNAALTAVNRRVVRRANQVVNDLHREVHGNDMPCTMAGWGRRADALVQFGVPSFEYPLSDAPSGLYFAGPLSATGSQAPLPEWWSDLDGTRPVIHVTQGTVANADYEQLIEPTLRALADENVLIVLATGGRPLDTLPPLPANARAATYLPYDELLPRTAVYVTNGGYGGVQYALRYGVPIVATGGKEDKPEVGARVAWSGVGRRIRSERPTPRALRRDILAVLNQPGYRQASQRVAADIAAAPGFAGLADIVDRLAANSARLTTEDSASSAVLD